MEIVDGRHDREAVFRLAFCVLVGGTAEGPLSAKMLTSRDFVLKPTHVVRDVGAR